MKYFTHLALLSLCACASQSTNSSQPTELTTVEMPEAANQLEQHRWLHQLVGNWKLTSEAIMEPGAEPMVWVLDESIEPMGGLWVLNKGTADNDGQRFHSLMTLGYDPAEGTFVGSWVDTMQTKLWTYVGTLDESGRVLTLSAEGPHISDPTKTASYRDVIELVNADEKKMSSSVQDDEGQWITFMTATGRRVK